MSEGPPIRIIRTGQSPMQQELLRRREVRQQELMPIYAMCAPDVPEDAARAALNGVYDALDASGQSRQIINFGSTTWGKGDYSSAQWYVDEAYRRQDLRRDVGFGPQIDVQKFGRLFYDEPWQDNPHWEVLVVNNDLNDKTWIQRGGREIYDFINFVYGSTNPEFPYSVQSVRRIIKGIDDITLRNAIIRRLLRHEVGHMFGLPSRNFKVEENLGKHCTNLCSMRQGLDIGAWARFTVEETNAGVHFCGDCKTELEVSRDRFRPHTPPTQLAPSV